MKQRDPGTTIGGLDLVEEAVHVLRRAAPGTLLCYYVGAIPFVLAALYFGSDMSQSGLAEQHLVGGALALAALFLWMKIWQSAFALKLSAQIAGESAPSLTVRALLRAFAAQTLIHATGLFLLLLAAQIILPVAWVYTFYQNATVLGLREPSVSALFRRSWKQARFAPLQNHSTLFVLGLFAMFVLLDVMIVMLSTPHLLKMIAGTETNFTLNAWSSFNSTFLIAALGVTYLCLDPLFKAVYTLRCFYGESRVSGEDLRVSLRRFRTAAAMIACGLTLAAANGVNAATPERPPPANSERGAQMDRSIDEVLKRPEYTWRSPRSPRQKTKTEIALWQRLREWARSVARSMADFLEKLFRSMRLGGGAPGKFSFSAEGLVYLLTAFVLVIVGVLAWLLWKTRSRSTNAELEATPAALAPDVASEDVTGEELPVDGWTKLALELLDRGELRLAMRAFYFSSLAHLAARSLVRIAKFKSNREYERELLLRSHVMPEVSQTFSENVSVFDRVWYGMHEINADLLQHFRANVERIRAC